MVLDSKAARRGEDTAGTHMVSGRTGVTGGCTNLGARPGSAPASITLLQASSLSKDPLESPPPL